jgi:isoquinoline 1-oxidoreductase beta subunit
MLKRRTFLLGGAGAVGALLVGWGVLPPRQRLNTSTPLPTQGSQVALNGWVKIAADNTVTIMMSKAEMGQGIHTGLAMLLAEELNADWSRVRVEEGPIDKIYNSVQNIIDDLPFRPDDDSAFKRTTIWLTRKAVREAGTMMTGGSSSINDLWTPMREAGASARMMLIGAAAEQWKAPAAECRAENGYVLHGPDHKASFGELSSLAALQGGVEESHRLQADRPTHPPHRGRAEGQRRGALRHRRAARRPVVRGRRDVPDARRLGRAFRRDCRATDAGLYQGVGLRTV